MTTVAVNRQTVTTLLTVLIVAFWVISAVVRIWQPWPEMHVLDAAMPVVVGYWFLAASKKNGNGATA